MQYCYKFWGRYIMCSLTSFAHLYFLLLTRMLRILIRKNNFNNVFACFACSCVIIKIIKACFYCGYPPTTADAFFASVMYKYTKPSKI